MTDSSPQETRQPEPPARQGGFRLRLFLLIAAPVTLLGAGGAYLLLSLAPKDGALAPLSDFLPAYLAVAALALALAAVLAWAADFALRSRLAAIERTLAQGSRRADSLAAVEKQWQGLRRLARAAHESLSRADDRLQDAEELKALQGAADDLQEKIRGWSETEIAPSFEAAGPLAEVAAALATLARHLDERYAEAHEVADLARQSVGEACEGIERANRESSRSAREIAALLTASAEVKRLAAEMAGRLRQPVRVVIPELRPAAGDPEPGPEFEAWRERVASFASRLESLERLALRAALELAAEGIAERREAGPWLDRVETLRNVALGARALREESKAIAAQTDAMVSSMGAASLETPAAASESAGSLPVEIVVMAERVEQWGNDAYSRSERLSALAQRLAGEFASATGLARAGADELAGLAARFEMRSATAEAEEAEAAVENWPAGARPLRLLTRDDVLPDEDDAAGAAEGTAPRDG